MQNRAQNTCGNLNNNILTCKENKIDYDSILCKEVREDTRYQQRCKINEDLTWSSQAKVLLPEC